jgi:hypothetical protein
VESGTNPHPHLHDTPLHGPVPPHGSLRAPSKRLVIAAAVVGVILAGCATYAVLFGASGLPAPYCQARSKLDQTLQQADQGSITPPELAADLREVETDLSEVGTIDPAAAGTWAATDIARLSRSVTKARTLADAGGGAEVLCAVRDALAQAPHC